MVTLYKFIINYLVINIHIGCILECINYILIIYSTSLNSAQYLNLKTTLLEVIEANIVVDVS